MEYKNLHSYKEFLREKHELNEGLFDWVGKLIGAAWEKNKKARAKLKHQEKIKQIQDEAEKQIDVELQKLGFEENTEEPVKENFIFEADAQPKLDQKQMDANKQETTSPEEEKKKYDMLKSKADQIDKIVNNIIKKAELKVDALINSAPDNEKAGFRIEKEIMVIDMKNNILKKKLDAAEKGGDKNTVKKLADEIKKNNDEEAQKISLASSGKASTQGEVIEVNNVQYTTQKPYRYDSGTKTVIITGKSENEGKIMGQYITNDFGDGNKVDTKEQEFTVDKIDSKFVPEKDKDYNYFSKTNKGLIKVKVLSEPKDNMVDVKVEGTDSEFKANIGALIDIKEKK